MFRLQPPERFDFTQPNQWRTWRERFQRFRSATKLYEESPDTQISTLVYCMGPDAKQIYKSFSFKKKEDEKSFDVILNKFEGHFMPKKNIMHERAKFHLRTQREGELIEQFIWGLHELSENCDFPHKNDQIRDRLVIGLRSGELSEKLQLRDDLSLEKAIEIARSYEQVRQQMAEMKEKSVDAVKQNEWKQNYPQKETQQQRCGKCNKKHKRQDYCPANGKRCRNCDKINHFAICCRFKAHNVRQVEKHTTEEYFLGAIYKRKEFRENAIDPWHVRLKVCENNLIFKIDTGADINVISYETFCSLRKKPCFETSIWHIQKPRRYIELYREVYG